VQLPDLESRYLQA